MEQKINNTFKRIEKKLIENEDIAILELFYKAKNEDDKEKRAYLLGKYYRNVVLKKQVLKFLLKNDFKELRSNLFDEGFSQYYDGENPNMIFEKFLSTIIFLIFAFTLIFIGIVDLINDKVTVGLNWRLQTIVTTGPLRIFFGIILMVLAFYQIRKK